MSEQLKTLKARVQHKHKTEADWWKDIYVDGDIEAGVLRDNVFRPLPGELIIYDRDDNYDYERFKIGRLDPNDPEGRGMMLHELEFMSDLTNISYATQNWSEVEVDPIYGIYAQGEQMYYHGEEKEIGCHELTSILPLVAGNNIAFDVERRDGDQKVVISSETIYSKGLDYELSNDRTYWIVVGIGTCKDTTLIIPSRHNGLPVKEIGDYAFEYNEGFAGLHGQVEKLIISEGIERIGASAFRGEYGEPGYTFSSLKEIVLPKSLKYIGEVVDLDGKEPDSPFMSCHNLEKINLEDTSIEIIPAHCFAQNITIKHLELPKTCKHIGDKIIGESPAYRSALETVIVPDGVESIAGTPFGYCDPNLTIYCGIETSQIPSEWSIVAFDGLDYENDDSHNEVLANWQFNKVWGFANDFIAVNEKLSSVDAINEIEKIIYGDGAIPEPTPGLLYSIDVSGLYAVCAGMGEAQAENIVIASSYEGLPVKEISESAFDIDLQTEAVKNIKSIYIPSTVESISFYAFYGCENLTDIVIPKSVTAIATDAFKLCSSLEIIYCEAESMPEDWDADWNKRVDEDADYINVVWGYKRPARKEELETESKTIIGAINEVNSKINNSDNPGTPSGSGVEIVTTSGTGTFYEATVPSITILKAGVSFVMVPHVNSNNTSPSLNVNNLGAKNIRRWVSQANMTTATGFAANWLTKGKPVRLIYDGTYWIAADLTKPGATDLYGRVSPAGGGVPTGGTLGQVLTTNALGEPEWMTPGDNAALDGFMWEGSNTITILGWNSDADNVPSSLIIPSYIDGIPVTAIGSNAFEGEEGLESVLLPDSIDAIGGRAFRATSLKSITIPANCTHIGEEAFSEIMGLSYINCANVTGSLHLGNLAFAPYDSADWTTRAVISTTNWTPGMFGTSGINSNAPNTYIYLDGKNMANYGEVGTIIEDVAFEVLDLNNPDSIPLPDFNKEPKLLKSNNGIPTWVGMAIAEELAF